MCSVHSGLIQTSVLMGGTHVRFLLQAVVDVYAGYRRLVPRVWIHMFCMPGSVGRYRECGCTRVLACMPSRFGWLQECGYICCVFQVVWIVCEEVSAHVNSVAASERDCFRACWCTHVLV